MKSESKTRRKSLKQKQIVKARRQMRIFYACLAAGIFGSILWLLALSTDYWVYFILPDTGVLMPSMNPGTPATAAGQTPRVLVEQMYAGMWRLCRVEWSNRTVASDAEAAININEDSNSSLTDIQLVRSSFCTQLSFYPSADVIAAEGLDSGLLDYRRAITGMAMIGICVALSANFFSFYAIRRPRYVLRRLAGCMQLGTAICLLVCIEIFSGAITYAHNSLPLVYPRQTRYLVYGFSFGLAWFCFAVFLLTGVVLLLNSRKEKNTEQDQPVLLGRI